MDGKGSIVWFNNGIRDLCRWENGESFHDSVWVFFSDLGDQESSHTGTGTTTEGEGDLETLQAVTAFSLLSDDIEDGVDQFSPFSVMTFSPVVSSTGLTEDEVVWSEKLSKWTSSDGVHGAWFKIHKDSSWNISTTGSFIVVDVDSFKLQ